MKLTPIKIKGKGGLKKTWKPPNPQHITQKRRRDEAVGADEGRTDEPPQRKRFKATKPAAAIEELPTEVLERIIFMSRNINFLRSSLRLGFRFSSRSFLTELLEAAFAPTWDVGYGRWRFGEEPMDMLSPENVPGDPDFQSDVLACPWLNMGLMLEAQQKWYRRTGGLRQHAPLLRPPEGLDPASWVPVRFKKNWEIFKRECAEFRSAEKARNGRLEQPIQLRCMMFPGDAWNVQLHPSTRIPERLLTGPFDWETARILVWLVHGGGRLPRESTWSWELTERGYQNVLALSDVQLAFIILLLLAGLGGFRHWPQFLLEQKLAAAQELQDRGSLEGREMGRCALIVLKDHVEWAEFWG